TKPQRDDRQSNRTQQREFEAQIQAALPFHERADLIKPVEEARTEKTRGRIAGRAIARRHLKSILKSQS
ncbi:MAG: hypothetical protein ACLQVF_41945, partial [Isosphaeraceae bacterium]